MRGVSGVLYGRDDELRRIEATLAASDTWPALVLLEGEPGAGKTSVWEIALERAAALGATVLSARASFSEAQLSLTAVTDLLDVVHGRVLGKLAEPRRRALSAALLLEDAGEPPDQRAVSLAFLDSLRLLAAQGPTIVALDDVQWLDAESTTLLSYAARRLDGEPVLFLLSRRSTGDEEPPPLELGQALPRDRIHLVQIGPLSLGALDRLVRERVSPLPRPVLRRIELGSGGNPFYALELARAIERGAITVDPGRPLSLPGSLSSLVRDRLASLPADVSDALLLAAMAPELTRSSLAAAAGGEVDLEPAVAAHVVAFRGEAIELTHPLIAAALYDAAPDDKRRRAHARLAAVSSDPEGRARHLALASTEPDESVAAALDEAARRARNRGATAAAAELAEQALLLTAEQDVTARIRRAGAAGRYVAESGNGQRARELLLSAVELLPPGKERARAITAALRTATLHEAVDLYEQALADAEDDAGLQASAHHQFSWLQFLHGNVPAALESARAACAAARQAGDTASLAECVAAVCRYSAITGAPDTQAALDEGLELERRAGCDYGPSSPRFTAGVVALWSGQLDEARTIFETYVQEATSEGSDWSRLPICNFLARIELRAGNWDVASALAEEAETMATAGGFDQPRSAALVAQAHLAAYRGRTDEALTLLEEATAWAARAGDSWARFSIRAAAGARELAVGAAAQAAATFEELLDDVHAAGVAEPCIFPVEADLFEALARLGRYDDLARVAEQLASRATSPRRPTVLAVAARGRGIALAATRDLDDAFYAFDAALSFHAEQPELFERARTLLALGIAQRRAKRRRDSRQSLEDARDEFLRLGATPWADRTRQELKRLGGRVTDLELTATERRVAELVAAGRSNREAAAELFVSVRAIESNLSNVYRKLGIRSRTQLAQHLGAVQQLEYR